MLRCIPRKKPVHIMKRKATAAIVGHGFDLRLQSCLMDEVEDHKDANIDLQLEAAYAQELKLDHRFERISIDTAQHAFGKEVERSIDRMGIQRNDILLLHTGDNELSRTDMPAQVVADRVVQLAISAYDRYPFRLVILVGALPRAEDIEMPKDDYLEKVNDFNEVLKEAAKDDVHLRYVLLRGFNFESDGSTEKDIDTWSDGIVPTNEGLWKYRNEVKQALTTSIPIMLQHARDLRLNYRR